MCHDYHPCILSAVSRVSVVMTAQQLSCDYLVVGAGAMGLAFADEIILNHPDRSDK